jgi:hypothetical protein
MRARATHADARQLAEQLRHLGERSRWVRPLVYVGHTLDALVAAALMLLTTARLALLELVPALWLGAITWDWRAHATGDLALPAVHGWVALAVVVLVMAANLAAYWCNVTLAFALVQPPPIRVRLALTAALPHAGVITAWAVVIGAVHAFVTVVLARTSLGWYGVGLSAVVVVQMWALIALPASLAGIPRHALPRRDRVVAALLTGVITLVALTPGLLLTRLAVFLMGLGAPSIGVLVLVVAIVLQIAATSSVHTVSIATKVNAARRSVTG